MRNAAPLNRLSIFYFAAGGAALGAFAGRPIGDLLLDYGFSWSPSFSQELALLALACIIEFPTITIGTILLPVSLFDEPPLILYAANGAFWGVVIFLALRFWGRKRNVSE